MCGIAGIYRRRGRDEADPRQLRAMADAIVHRGPDDYGYLLLDSRNGEFQIGQGGFQERSCDVSLGSRRLSIIDLSPNGRQPMANETNDVFVVFNGEIYNYLELRETLIGKGHRFRSRTDTEVIVHAHEEWGEDCVAKFNGMWALAIWDQRKRELFCSRDRFGIKPFYYYVDDGVFLFASEIKGILPALDARPGADYGVVGDYLARRPVCGSSETFFDGIQRLRGAHNLTVSASGVRIRRYWDYKTQSQTYDEGRPVDTFRELFDDAVRLRLRSDVPVGVALSGGLDSTSVLAGATRLSGGRRMKTFTAAFPGEEFDEHEYATLASAHCGAEKFTVNYQAEKFIPELRRAIRSLDYPSVDGQILPRWRLMRLASRHVKVILEGQGADEALAGYIRKYFSPYMLDQLGRLKSRPFLPVLGKLLRTAWEVPHRHGPMVYGGLLRSPFANPAIQVMMRRSRASGRVYTPAFEDLLSRRPVWSPPRDFQDRLTNLLHYDHMSGILPTLLKFGDALSMASSIESRVPFLDHRLVEFLFLLPPRHKMDGPVTKGILRAAVAGTIPERILNRRDKIGFYTPLGRWLTGSLESDVRPLLLSERCRKRNIFDGRKIDRLLTPAALKRLDVAFAVYRWLSVELWFRMFIDGEGAGELSHP